MNDILIEKINNLKQYLKNEGSVAVAFSGGVDSTLLAKVARDVLGPKAIAVTLKSPVVPEFEMDDADEFCRQEGIEHIVVECDVFEIEGFRENPVDRCYICKKALFSKLIEVAASRNISCVVDGSNRDDEGDYRPGMRALAELKIKSPLKACGFTKEDVRAYSKELGLPTWHKPSYACLASRFPYGTEITAEGLKRVELAERFIMDHGIAEVRVRTEGNTARIEVRPDQIAVLASEEMRESIVSRFRELGFVYVSLDLRGYRTGSLNETLK